jgi:hypothetical protein
VPRCRSAPRLLGFCQWPTTVFRASRMRVSTKPNSVAVRRLVQVHEVHVDFSPGEIAVELRVQVEERLRQCRQTTDPHLGRRERVHPGDHADAGGRGVRLEAQPADRLRALDDRSVENADGDRGGRVERTGDLARVRVDLSQRLVAVEVLAAGCEPDLELLERLHEASSSLAMAAPSLVSSRARGSEAAACSRKRSTSVVGRRASESPPSSSYSPDGSRYCSTGAGPSR